MISAIVVIHSLKTIWQMCNFLNQTPTLLTLSLNTHYKLSSESTAHPSSAAIQEAVQLL